MEAKQEPCEHADQLLRGLRELVRRHPEAGIPEEVITRESVERFFEIFRGWKDASDEPGSRHGRGPALSAHR